MRRPTVIRGGANVLVAVLFLQLWLAESTLDALQIMVELIMGGMLLWFLRTCRFSRTELGLCFVYVASMSLSALYLPVGVVLLNAKIFGLSILSLLLFSKVRVDATIAGPILAANIALTVYQALIGDPWWFALIVKSIAGSWSHLLGSRPLGLFMNTHASATLTALFVLWMGRRPLHRVVGLALLLATRSFFVMTAYASQLAWDVVRWLRLSKFAAVLAVVGVFVAFANAASLLDRDLTTISSFFTIREQVGYTAILEQLLSGSAYSMAFTLLPLDSTVLAGNFINWAGNEVMYFTVLQQGGLLLTAWYLAILFRRTRKLRVFAAVSMLHYGMATTPIVIFLLLQPRPARSAVRVSWRQRVKRRIDVQPPAAPAALGPA